MDAEDKGAAGFDQATADRAADAASRIAAAFASRPDTSPDEIVALTQRLMQIFGAGLPPHAASRATPRPQLVTPSAALTAGTESRGPTPAIPIDQAVTDDKVYCLCCGRGFTMLKRHLKAEHGLTEEEYRALFGLPEDMPLVAPNYSERKAAYAKRVGLGKYQRELPPSETSKG